MFRHSTLAKYIAERGSYYSFLRSAEGNRKMKIGIADLRGPFLPVSPLATVAIPFYLIGRLDGAANHYLRAALAGLP